MRAVLSLNRYLFFHLCVFTLPLSFTSAYTASSDHLYSSRQASTQDPLVNFQVSEPVVTPNGPRDEHGCVYSQILMSHEFGNSYGVPFVGQ